MEIMNTEGPHPGLVDKIVLLGYTDSARDKVITPLERQLDGVELHATLVHNLLYGELIHEVSPWTTILVIAALGGLLALLQLRRIRKRGAWIIGVGALVLFIAYAIVAHVLFSHAQLLIEVMAPLLSALVITLTALTTSLATEGREKAQLRSAFGQYLQSTLVERLLQDPARLRLGGQRRELTVLFSDIRGFSRFSEDLEPEVLSDFLNEYLTPMTELVMQDSGMLDKYIGDAVMAVYGAPLQIDDHATRACGTALAMIRALEPLNASWESRGLPKIQIGIGINTGPMSVGNMGSERRFDYTVMGDAVNLGARLESLTKSYRVDILVGEDTMQAAKSEFVFRAIDRVRVIGRQAAASVYELCGTTEAPDFSPDDLACFAEGLQAYRAQDWLRCTERLGRFLETHPDDGPSQTLLARVPKLRAAQLPEDWDGVFDQRTK
jgi:adenylate cyclase